MNREGNTGSGRWLSSMETRDLQVLPASDPHPLPNSYWLIPGRLLAGEYPGTRIEAETRQQLGRVLGVGVDFFLDLTEEGERTLVPYSRLLPSGVLHRRMAVPDLTAPSREEMMEILDTLDAALRAGRVVFVHCRGGIGRTATVVGCYLVRHGVPGDQVLGRIAELRIGVLEEAASVPETAEQRRMVVTWFEERRRPTGVGAPPGEP